MMIVYWIAFGLSALILLLIFLRRLRLTANDIKFQSHLAEQEESQSEEMDPLEISTNRENPDSKPSGSVRNNFLKADEHFSRKEWPEAEGLLLTVIALDPNHLDAHHKLGMLYMSLGDFSNAELFFNKLINLKKDPVYYSNLGAALYQQQRLVEAAEAYENAITLDDKRGNRLQSLAQVYHELDNHDKALHYFERAERRKPRDMELKLILADYYERLQRLEEAAAMLKKVLEADPYNDEVKERLGRLNG